MTCGDHSSVDGSIYYTQINEANPGKASCIEDTFVSDPGLIFSKKVDLRKFPFSLLRQIQTIMQVIIVYLITLTMKNC